MQMQQPRLPTEVQGEVVFIDSIEYSVPKPWTGKRVAVPPDTTARLQLIPQDLTFNRTEIYLRNEAIEPLKAMAEAARNDNVILQVDSGYRSVRYQRVIFRQFLEKGQNFKNISRYVAPPGYSEHSLGTVVDFFPSSHSFSKSKAYPWLRKHAGSFGFHEALPRHSKDKKPWEPWHWKYTVQPKTEEIVPLGQPIQASGKKIPAPVATVQPAQSTPPETSGVDHR